MSRSVSYRCIDARVCASPRIDTLADQLQLSEHSPLFLHHRCLAPLSTCRTCGHCGQIMSRSFDLLGTIRKPVVDIRWPSQVRPAIDIYPYGFVGRDYEEANWIPEIFLLIIVRLRRFSGWRYWRENSDMGACDRRRGGIGGNGHQRQRAR